MMILVKLDISESFKYWWNPRFCIERRVDITICDCIYFLTLFSLVFTTLKLLEVGPAWRRCSGQRMELDGHGEQLSGHHHRSRTCIIILNVLTQSKVAFAFAHTLRIMSTLDQLVSFGFDEKKAKRWNTVHNTRSIEGS